MSKMPDNLEGAQSYINIGKILSAPRAVSIVDRFSSPAASFAPHNLLKHNGTSVFPSRSPAIAPPPPPLPNHALAVSQ